MYFASDNWAGAADKIAQSLQDNATGYSPAYGASESDRRLEQRFNDLFEKEVAVFFVGTGTAANSLALSAMNRPGGFVLCHREAHLIEDECGAPEFFTSGARLAPIDGATGKMEPAALSRALQRFDPEFVHHGQPMAVSVTQATEVGTVYSSEALSELTEIAHQADLPVHMDGARFANALVRLDLTPAEMTWKCGVDVLSFGATKNGCWCAEALVFFDPAKAKQLPFIRKRAAQLFSKTRFIASQLHAYLDEDLWLDLARQANSMCDRLAQGLRQTPQVKIAWPSESNELFVVMSRQLAKQLQESDAHFYEWPLPMEMASQLDPSQGLYRFVTSFCTTTAEVDQFVDLISRSANPR